MFGGKRREGLQVKNLLQFAYLGWASDLPAHRTFFYNPATKTNL